MSEHNHETRCTKRAMKRGFMQKCPNCGQGALFYKFLKTVDHCAECDEAIHHHRADDGPAYLTILIVGHLLAPIIHVAWVQFRPSPLMLSLILSLACIALSLILLPRLKGAIIGLQWAKRMHGFNIAPSNTAKTTL